MQIINLKILNGSILNLELLIENGIDTSEHNTDIEAEILFLRSFSCLIINNIQQVDDLRRCLRFICELKLSDPFANDRFDYEALTLERCHIL